MASNFTPQEREERIKMIGDYACETGESTREIAEFFTNHYFKISHVTVHDYLKRYRTIYVEKVQQIDAILENKPKTIEDENVKLRVLEHAKYAVMGYTIEEIVRKTGNTYFVVYRDLTHRLPKLNHELYLQIQEILKKHSRDNLR